MWYSTPANSTTSHIPTLCGEISNGSISKCSTPEPRSDRAVRNPYFDLPGTFPFHTNESVANTRVAPRRSASKEKNPSQAPMSRKVLPRNVSGMRICASFFALSSSPGVTTPWPRSMRWNQRIARILLAIDSGEGVIAGVVDSVIVGTLSLGLECLVDALVRSCKISRFPFICFPRRQAVFARELGRQRNIGRGRHLAPSIFHLALQDVQCFSRTLIPTKRGRALLPFSA